MKITLIRHGETTWNVLNKVQGQADPPLTERGIQQARNLEQKMHDRIGEYCAIYSSQRQRASNTAQILVENHPNKIKVQLDRRLNSRNLGDISGMTLADIKTQFPDQYQLWVSGNANFCPPGGESTQQLLDFTTEFLEELKQKHDYKDNILIVAHRENIWGLIFKITGKKMETNPLESIQNCTPYDFSI